MFKFALITGIYSYLIFVLGLAGELTKSVVAGLTVLVIFTGLYIMRDDFVTLYKRIISIRFPTQKKGKKVLYIFISLLLLQAIVNLIGVLGPELSFDALWYHLMLPKLYLLH